jgi:hypothetical protein
MDKGSCEHHDQHLCKLYGARPCGRQEGKSVCPDTFRCLGRIREGAPDLFSFQDALQN